MADGPWLLVMAATVASGVALTGGALVAWRRGNGRLAAGLLAGGIGLAGLYLVALVAVSAASERRVLAAGETKRFCGFYLDCHLGVSVDQVRTAPRVGAGATSVAARGTFHIVTLRVSSDARRATLAPYGLLAIAGDSRGRHYRRDHDAERALLGVAANQPLEQEVPAGGSYTRTLVFDLPADARDPVLSVTEQGFPDVAIEALLIGDEDSLMHPPTLHSLTPAGSGSAANQPEGK